MKKLISVISLLLLSVPAHAALNVFACEPEWAALTQQLAGDKANIYTATGPLQDPHQVQTVSCALRALAIRLGRACT